MHDREGSQKRCNHWDGLTRGRRWSAFQGTLYKYSTILHYNIDIYHIKPRLLTTWVQSRTRSLHSTAVCLTLCPFRYGPSCMSSLPLQLVLFDILPSPGILASYSSSRSSSSSSFLMNVLLCLLRILAIPSLASAVIQPMTRRLDTTKTMATTICDKCSEGGELNLRGVGATHPIPIPQFSV